MSRSPFPLCLCGPATWVACLFLVSACGGDDTPHPAVANPSNVQVAPPDIEWLERGTPDVALPAFTCPVGWAAVLHGDVTTCEPYPAGLMDCADHEVHLPGTAGCAPVGAPCPAGLWPEGLPAANVVYVEPGVVSGDGSQSSPVATLAEAMALVDAGQADTIALSTGLHVGGVAVNRDVALVGACAELTWITEPDCFEDDAVIEISDAEVSISDLSVVDSSCMSVRINGGTLDLDGVVSARSTARGMWFEDAVVTGTEVVIRETAPRPSTLSHGQGISMVSGTLELRRSALLDNMKYGLHHDYGVAVFEDSVIAGTGPSAEDESDGMAVVIKQDDVTLRRVALVDNRDKAVWVTDDATLTADTVRIDGVALDAANGTISRGLVVNPRAAMTCDQVWITGVFELGVGIFGSDDGEPRVTVDCRDLVIQGEDTAPPGEGVRGIWASSGADVTLERVLVEDMLGEGLMGWAASWMVSDVTVRRTATQNGSGMAILGDGGTWTIERFYASDNAGGGAGFYGDATANLIDVALVDNPGEVVDFDGWGLFSDGDAVVTADRIWVDGTHGVGLVALSESTLEVHDAVISNGRYGPDGAAGAAAVGSADLDLNRVHLVDNTGVSLIVMDDGHADLQDVHVQGGQSTDLGFEGLGLFAVDESSISGNLVLIEDAVEVGLMLWDESKATLEQLEIRNIRQNPCAAELCSENAGTWAVYSRGRSVRLYDFWLTDNGRAGVGGESGTIDLENGIISGHDMALNTTGAQFDTRAVDLDENTEEMSDDDSVLPVEHVL